MSMLSNVCSTNQTYSIQTYSTPEITEKEVPKTKLDDLQERMGKIVAKTVQDICADYEQRKLNCQKDPTIVNRGMWYPNDYYKALVQLGATAQPRLQFFIKKDYFFHAMPPKGFFDLEPSAESDSGFTAAKFKLKQGVKPSDALNSFKTELSLVDCSQVCQIGQYHALLEVLGEEKFNKLLRADGRSPMIIGNFSPDNPLGRMMRKEPNDPGVVGNRPVKVGQLGGFKNIDHYSIKHLLMGESASLNIIVLDETPNEQKFVGFGLPGEGATESEVEQKLIDEYNEAPLDLSLVSDSTALKLCKLDKSRIDLYKNICNAYKSKKPITRDSIHEESFGYQPQASLSFDVKVIQGMIDTPFKKFA